MYVMPPNSLIAVMPASSLAGDGAGARAILREHRRRQAVGHAVGDAHRLVVVLDAHEQHHRAEQLLARDVHLRRHVGQDGRLEEVPLLGVDALAAATRARAPCLTALATSFSITSSCSGVAMAPTSTTPSRPAP